MIRITPGGHHLGRKPDRPDARDRRYGVTITRTSKPVKAYSDMRAKLPPAYDQGNIGSCGPNSGAALMVYFFPECKKLGFSRLQIYADVRNLEHDFNEDAGVETRDVLKVLTKHGAGHETQWPYDINKLYVQPPKITPMHRLSSYWRLVADNDFITCLSEDRPFILGFMCFESIDSEQLARTGIMTMPGENERMVGGHDVLVVGHDLNFKKNPDFLKSGIDPALVNDEALLIRNSWGTDWGIHGGHFWMPLLYASNPSIGGDAWTGRRT